MCKFLLIFLWETKTLLLLLFLLLLSLVIFIISHLKKPLASPCRAHRVFHTSCGTCCVCTSTDTPPCMVDRRHCMDTYSCKDNTNNLKNLEPLDSKLINTFFTSKNQLHTSIHGNTGYAHVSTHQRPLTGLVAVQMEAAMETAAARPCTWMLAVQPLIARGITVAPRCLTHHCKQMHTNSQS